MSTRTAIIPLIARELGGQSGNIGSGNATTAVLTELVGALADDDLNGASLLMIAAATSADLASDPLALIAGDQLDGNLRWAITFKGTPTDADAALPWMTQNTVPTLSQIAQLSAASKPTLLIPADTSTARLLPAYFGGTL